MGLPGGGPCAANACAAAVHRVLPRPSSHVPDPASAASRNDALLAGPCPQKERRWAASNARSRPQCRPGWSGGCAGGEAALLRVLGIDPGIATCGYGLIDAEDGGRGRPQVLVYGALRPRMTGDAARLCVLYAEICRLIDAHRPDAAAVERLYHTRNVSTAASVGLARGVILLALAHAGLPFGEYTPTEVKLAVAGYGGADKRQMQTMVAAQLGLADPPRPDDAADALGLCLCHLCGEGLRVRLAAVRQPLLAEGRGRLTGLEAEGEARRERPSGLPGRRGARGVASRPSGPADGAGEGSA